MICAQCAYAKPDASDLTLRICHGRPPTPVLMPVRGAMGVTAQPMAVRPTVGASDMACGVFKERDDFAPRDGEAA